MSINNVEISTLELKSDVIGDAVIGNDAAEPLLFSWLEKCGVNLSYNKCNFNLQYIDVNNKLTGIGSEIRRILEIES